MEQSTIQQWPLSTQQKHGWLQQQRAIRQLTLTLPDSYDLTLFEQALNALLQQHDIFATSWQTLPGLRFPNQAVGEHPQITLANGHDAADWAVYWQPASRQLVLRTSPLVADSLSLFTLAEQLEQHYLQLSGDSQAAAELNDIAEEMTQYGEFAAWQQDLLQGEEADDATAYWQAIELTPQQHGFLVEDKQVAIVRASRQQWQAPAALLEDAHLLQTSLMTSFLVLQAQLNNDEQALGWIELDTRNEYEELASSLGPYGQFLPVQLTIDKDSNANSIAALVEQQLDDHLEWLEFYNPDTIKSATTNQHTRWTFSLLQQPDSALQPHLSSDLSSISDQIHLQAVVTPDAVELLLTISDSRVPDSLADTLLSRFIQLTDTLLANATQPIGKASLSLAADMQAYQQASAANQLEADQDNLCYPAFIDQFNRMATEYPAQTAVVFNDQQLNYQQLAEQSDAFARAVLAQQLPLTDDGQPAPVALVLNRSVDMVVALLGCMKAGHPYVPLDPEQHSQRLQALLTQLNTPLVIVDKAEQLAEIYDNTCWSVAEKPWLAQRDQQDLPAISPEQLAYIIYTSGSTGQPKGVGISHDNLSHYLAAVLAHVTPDAGLNYASVSTLNADLGNTVLFGALATGGCIHLVDFDIATNGEHFADYMQQQQIDVLKIVPSHLKALRASLENSAALLPRVALLCGGEAFDSELAQQLHTERADNGLNQLRLFNHYGPTEVTIGCFIFDLDKEGCFDQNPLELASMPVGRPLGNNQFILIAPNGELAPAGTVGELWVTGPGVSPGYYQAPTISASVFVDRDGIRYYRTGDNVRLLRNGALEFIGRVDHQVKLRGFRVELGAIRQVLLDSPHIIDAEVLVEGDSNAQQLIAYTVANPGNPADEQQLTELLAAALPPYMVPGSFIMLPQLPLTANGKLDRRKLKALADEQREAEAATPPETETEQQLAAIWQQLLPVDVVGRRANFFNLGGHSLLATQLVFRIQQQMHTDLPLGLLFDHPVLAEMAALIDQHREQYTDSAETSSLISAIPADQPAPLSHAQQRLWFLQQLAPESVFYNVPATLNLAGELDKTALQQAFNDLAQRHQILTTRFVDQNGDISQMPRQTELTITHKTRGDCYQQDIQQDIAKQLHKPFDLLNDIPVRLYLYDLSTEQQTEHRLVVIMHHLICDGWSRDLLIEQLLDAYQARTQNQAPSWLSDEQKPMQYRDFAHWQIAQGDSLYQSQIDWWTAYLGDDHAPLQLNTDFSRPVRQQYQGGQHSFTVPAALTAKLNELAQQQNATLFMTVLTAWHTLLYRYSNQSQVRVGIPIAGRNKPGMDQMVGLLANTLVTQTKPEADGDFTQLLAQVRQDTRDAFDRQDVPFEQLVNVLQPARSTSYSPLFQAFFSLAPAKPSTLSVGDLTLTTQSSAMSASKFDLSLMLDQHSDSQDGDYLSATLEFDSALFKPATVERLANNFMTLLDSIVTQPTQTLATLPLLSTQDQTIVAQGEPTAHTQDVAQQIMAHCRKHAQQPAIIFNEQTLSYGDLGQRVAGFIAGFNTRGLTTGQRVILHMERSPDVVAAMIAALVSGLYFVPLDPNLPTARKDYIVSQSDPSLIVSSQPFSASDTLSATLPVWIADAPQATLSAVLSDSDFNQRYQAGYILYTSGSTGQPKGVSVPVSALNAHLDGMIDAVGFTARHHWLARTTISFDISLLELFMPLNCGSTLVLASAEQANDPDQLIHLIKHHSVNVIQATPGAWRQLLDSNWHATPGQLLLTGGEALPQALADELTAQGNTLYNVYGPTEATIWASIKPLKHQEPVTLGHALKHYQCYVISDQLQQQPVNVIGQLAIAGPGLANGYFNRDDLTAERFIDNPFGPGKLYLTGDLASLNQDGTLHYHGRSDDQIKWRGYRIEPGEIAETLQRHPEVSLAYCKLQDNLLLAYYTSTSGESLAQSTLEAALTDWLPAYMLPSHFMHLSEFPLSASRKIDAKALPAWSGVPADVEQRPATDTEQQIIALWQQVMGDIEIAPDANFFALGGHSLMLTRLLALIREAFSPDIPLYQLMEADTPAKQALLVADFAQAQSLPALTPTADPADWQPLSFAQQRLYFLQHFISDSAAYHIPLRVNIAKPVDIEQLSRSLNTLIARHPQLRTRFAEQPAKADNASDTQQTSSEAMQQALPNATIQLQQVSSTDALAQLASQPFDLAAAPLIRAGYVEQSDNIELMLVVHHIIVDGWSLQLLIRELIADYQQHALNEPATVNYTDFTVWQQHMQQQGFSEQLDYWTNYLSGDLPVLSLPTDKPRPAVQHFAGAQRTIALSADTSAALASLAKRHQTSRFTVMMSIYAMMLSRYANQQEICIGTPVANRHVSGTESIVGLFANTQVYRVFTRPATSFAELLHAVKHDGIQAQRHQDLPFEQLVEALSPERNTSQTPLFQTLFTLQDDIDQQQTPEGWTMQPLPEQRAKFDLSLTVSRDSSDQDAAPVTTLSLNYNTDLFMAVSIDAMLQTMTHMIEQICANDGLTLSAYAALPAEQSFNLKHWNQPKTDFPLSTLNETVMADFARQVSLAPTRVALQFGREADSQTQLSYQQLDNLSNKVAHRLMMADVQTNSQSNPVVGLLCERSLALLTSIYGVSKAGAAWLPLSTDNPVARSAYMLNDANVTVLIVHRHQAELARQIIDDCQANFDRMVSIQLIDDSFSDLVDFSSQPVNIALNSHDIAYVIYTSGSTGEPKGVEVPHRGLKNRLYWQQSAFNLTNDDIVLQKTPYNFDVSVWELYWPLMFGARLVIAEPDAHKDPASLQALCLQTGVTLMHFVPSMLQVFVEHLADQHADLPALRLIACSGEALPAGLVNKTHQQLSDVELFNLYGPTEASIDVSWYHCQRGENLWQVPIGKPVANTALYVLDSEQQLLPPGAPGELYLAGEGLARGYLNRPALTAERFVTVAIEGQIIRLYRTGDLARWRHDGELEYLGRVDNQIKLRGLRIELSETEALLAQHPAIEQATVLALPANQPTHLRAYVTLTAGTVYQADSTTEADILAALATQLPDYMVPSRLVVLDNMPVNANGKTDRKQLAAIEPVSHQDSIQLPETELEKAVCELISRLLSSDENVVSVTMQDDLFQAGAHSLWLINFQRELRNTFNVDLGLNQLFSHKKVVDLVRLIAEQQPASATQQEELVTLARSGNSQAPTLFCVHSGTGVSSQYQTLANALAARMHVTGINAVDALKHGEYQGSVPEIAARYVQTIKAAQPQGPYYLIGWSLGAHIALSMAQQLEAQGDQVAWLGTVDARLPAGFLSESTNSQRDLAFWQNSLTLLNPSITLTAQQQETLAQHVTSTDSHQAICDWAASQQLLPATCQADTVLRLLNLIDHSARLLRESDQSDTPVNAPFATFWASDSLQSMGEATAQALQHATAQLADGDYQSIEIDSNHQHIIVDATFIDAVVQQLLPLATPENTTENQA